MNPSLSIITINRNNAAGLRKTIESVVSQNCDDFEYILIDGASTDGSLDIIKNFAVHPKYGKKISCWLSEPDTGIYNAINKGIKKAKGSLIALMHSGDWYLPDVFCDVIELHKKYPQHILYGALKACSNGIFESVWAYAADILPNQMIPHLSSFVPLSIYQTYGYYDENYKIAGDYEAFLRFYTSGIDFLFVDKIICCFNLEGISQTNKYTQIETDRVRKKYGFYTPPSFKKKFASFLKKLLRW